MTNSKHTKRTLCASVLSVMLCAAMLAGSTFAWFTDSVTSGKNKIVAGNLDVELEYSTDLQSWNDVDANTNVFKEGALWEPGYTEVVYLRISNAGSLALKYKFAVNVEDKVIGQTADGKDIDLSNFIKFGVVTAPETAYSQDAAGRAAAVAAVAADAQLISAGYSKEGDMVKDAAPEVLAMVVYMPEEIGNEANHGTGKQAPSIDMGISLTATQDTVEEDSFGNDYDEGAAYPVVTQDAFNEALETAKPGDKIYLENRTYEMPAAKYELPDGVSIIGKEGAVISVDGANPELTGNSNYGMKISGDNVTISNVEITGGNIGKGEYDSVVRITGNNVTLDNVTIHATKEDTTAPQSKAAVIISNTSGADNVVTIKNCDLFSSFKAIHIVDGTEGVINIEGCSLQGTYTLNANTTSVYSIYAKDTLFNGWVSYGPSATKAVFENCEFTPYYTGKYLVAYADTDFINCTFDPGFFPETKDNYSQVMTFTDCYRGDTKITAENILTEFHVDNDSDSIDQATGWTVIVDGATVLPEVLPPDETDVEDPF